MYFALRMEKLQDSRQQTFVNVYQNLNVYFLLNAYCRLINGFVSDLQLINNKTKERYKRYMLH